MTQPLSPAALNVWDKFCGIVEDHGPPRLALAAALRAAVNQVVPKPNYFDEDMLSTAALRHHRVIRDQFLAIAAELEAQ